MKDGAPIASDEISGGLDTVGIMLPYAPLHYLLFFESYPENETNFDALVMTSGNLSDEPIAVDNEEALESGICANGLTIPSVRRPKYQFHNSFQSTSDVLDSFSLPERS
jgi:hypothetical protein